MTGTRGRRIYHLTSTEQWATDGPREGAIAGDQLQRHGFVHCCTREQILEIASWWLRDQAPLVALEFEADEAGDVRFERADLGREYPHVYNPLPRRSLVAAHLLSDLDALPPELADPPPGFEVRGAHGGRDVSVRWRGGRFDGDAAVIEEVQEAIAEGREVEQFPGVRRRASAATPYDAFCVVVDRLDHVDAYFGDGFGEEMS